MKQLELNHTPRDTGETQGEIQGELMQSHDNFKMHLRRGSTIETYCSVFCLVSLVFPGTLLLQA